MRGYESDKFRTNGQKDSPSGNGKTGAAAMKPAAPRWRPAASESGRGCAIRLRIKPRGQEIRWLD